MSSTYPAPHRFRSGALGRSIGLAGATLAVLALVPAFALGAWSRRCVPNMPSDAVLVPLAAVPPDACLALFGPGPCRPHSAASTSGWTDAVAGPPPAWADAGRRSAR